jgi:putative ABC transport system permease protein
VTAAYSQFPFQSEYFLQPMVDIYLRSGINMEVGATSDIRYVYLLGSIGLIILLLASVNYMNLATARSARRSKEVGIRKVMGALRGQVIGQLLGESFILTFFGFVLAVFLAYLLLPGFNHLIDQELPFNVMGNGWILTGMLTFGFLLGALSGLYPALIVSAVTPVKAFKGKVLDKLGAGLSLRNTLIVGQFMAAIVLAVSSVVVYQQLQYIKNKKLGFNRDHIVYVPFYDDRVNEKIPSIREHLLANPRIGKVSVSNNLILNTGNQGIVDQWEGNDQQRDLYCYRYFVDEEFLDLYEIPLAAGRNFSSAYPTDSTQSYLLNETAVKAVGWTPETAIGKTFRDGRVIGVVQDFHFQPMDLQIEPLFMKFRDARNQPLRSGNVAMKVQGEDLGATLAYIRKTFKDAAPRTPFDFQFLDESFEGLYDSQKRLGQVFNIFTALALFIACLGLFGLVSYQIVQRTKEIGIRKVLGASAAGLVGLLSKDFLKLVGIALAIAIPLAWYAMQQWLNNFAYRIEIRWWIFLLVIVPALLIAFLTVGVQSLRAALANPVEALQEE